MFFDLLKSRTIGLAFTIIPLLGDALKLDKADDWVYSQLPEKWKQRGTLKEFEALIKSGKQFMKDLYAFTHS